MFFEHYLTQISGEGIKLPKRSHKLWVSHCAMCTFWKSPHSCGEFQRGHIGSVFFIVRCARFGSHLTQLYMMSLGPFGTSPSATMAALLHCCSTRAHSTPLAGSVTASHAQQLMQMAHVRAALVGSYHCTYGTEKWMSNVAWGVLEFVVSHCAMFTFSKVCRPLNCEIYEIASR